LSSRSEKKGGDIPVFLSEHEMRTFGHLMMAMREIVALTVATKTLKAFRYISRGHLGKGTTGEI